jgi:hypothetical protein
MAAKVAAGVLPRRNKAGERCFTTQKPPCLAQQPVIDSAALAARPNFLQACSADPGHAHGMQSSKREDNMERTLKRVCTGALLAATLVLAAGCTTYSAQCKGGYPDGGGIQDMSPYSPNAGSHQPDCEGRY